MEKGEHVRLLPPNSNPLSCVTGLRYDHNVAQMVRYVTFSIKIDVFR